MQNEVTRMKRNLWQAVLAVGMSLLLLAGTLIPSARTFAEEGMEGLTASAPAGDVGSLKIFEREDFADAEIKALLNAETLETEALTDLLDETYTTDSETPDLIIILSDQKDAALPGGKTMGVNDAKKIVNHLRAAVGNDVPVIWTVLSEASEPVSSAEVFGFVQEMEDSFAYPNIYANYTYYQKGSSEGRSALAERIVLPLSGRGVYPLVGEEEPEPAYNDVVFYISETGNDKAYGMSPDQPLLTGTGFVNRIRAIYGKELKGLPVGMRIVIEVTGEIQFSKSSQTVFGIFAGTNAPRDAAGNKVPVLIETYQYNGQNRATIRGDYLPHDEGSSRMCIESPATFRNIKIASAATSGGLAMHNFFVTAVTVVFDNTTFEARSGVGFTLSPSNNCWTKDYEVEEGKIVETEIILKNGVYDHTTGVALISGLNTGSLWRSADNGGSIPEGRMLKNRVIVTEGAKVGNLYALTGKLPAHSVEIIVEKGGEVTNLAVTDYHRSQVTYNTDVSIRVNNAFISREIHGLGQQTVLNGNVDYSITDSTVQGRPEDELEYSDMLGDEFSALNGNFRFSMKNTLFSMVCGLNSPSSIYAGGYYAGITEGTYSASYENVSFVYVPNKTLTSSDTHLYFAPVGGILAGNYEISMQSVIADTSAIETSAIRFGAEEASMNSMKVLFGEEGRPDRSVVFYGGDLYLGGEEVTFGEEKEGTASDRVSSETVCEIRAFAPVFHDQKTVLTPYWAEKTDKGVNGSVKAAFYDASFEEELVLAAGAVFGDLTVDLQGVKAEHLTTGFIYPTEETVKVTTETGESVQIITADYDQLVRGRFTINGVNAGEFRESGFDETVNEIAFIDGQTTEKPVEPETESGEEGGQEGTPEGQNGFPWPIAAGAGAAVVIAAVVAVILASKKKKKDGAEGK